jgi:dTDP-4-dehydrorhamnose 3,5-epimerase
VRFSPTALFGVVVVDLEPIPDERGFFARAWCEREFAEHGLTTSFVQENVSSSPRVGTLRGLHLQRSPHSEVKLVRCTRGSVWDVAADLRTNSPTYLHAFGVELTAENHRMLYVPEGCGHGFLTLTADAEVRYLTSRAYAAEAATGARYDDPALGIDWPRSVELVSANDLEWPPLGKVQEQ